MDNKKKFFQTPVQYKTIKTKTVPERIINLLKEYFNKYYSLDTFKIDSYSYKSGEASDELHYTAIDNWLMGEGYKKGEWVTFDNTDEKPPSKPIKKKGR